MYELLPDAPAHQHAAPRPGDIYRSVGSPQKAAEEIGFRADVSLADGLKETVEWMHSH
jgi:nucleoside-diphosphate-sugar epimerase